jgi:two-component system LytT family sensor kinase
VTYQPFRQRKWLRIASHVLFWIFIVSLFTFVYGVRSGNYFEITKILMGTLPIDIGFTYFVLYFLIPRYLLQRRYVMFAGTLLVTFTIVVIVEWTINYFIMYPLVYADYAKWKDKMHYLSGDAFFLYITIGFVVLSASVIKLAKYWFGSQQAQAVLEIQNRKSELALLRSQVNPHFLFNTLNNIDALIRRDPDKASDSILKLSWIMRYFIYEADTDKVQLTKEIEYLESFIDLQRIRYRNTAYIEYTVTGDPGNLEIAPMLFVPFVENAFKHGVRRDQVPGIVISLEISDPNIRFLVWNYYDPGNTSVKDPVQGIGLKNVEKRLELLYPGRYELKITEDGGKFRTELTIRLK